MNLSGGPGFPEGGDVNSMIYFLPNVLQIKLMIMKFMTMGAMRGRGVLAVGCVGGRRGWTRQSTTFQVLKSLSIIHLELILLKDKVFRFIRIISPKCCPSILPTDGS